MVIKWKKPIDSSKKIWDMNNIFPKEIEGENKCNRVTSILATD